jgi:hypothetical protein
MVNCHFLQFSPFEKKWRITNALCAINIIFISYSAKEVRSAFHFASFVGIHNPKMPSVMIDKSHHKIQCPKRLPPEPLNLSLLPFIV